MKTMITLITVGLLTSTSLMAAMGNQTNFKMSFVIDEVAANASEVSPVANSQGELNQNRLQNLRAGIFDGSLTTIANASVVGNAVVILDKDQRIYVLDPNENRPEFSSSLSTMGHLLFAEVQDSAR